jgi:hypothetical protein
VHLQFIAAVADVSKLNDANFFRMLPSVPQSASVKVLRFTGSTRRAGLSLKSTAFGGVCTVIAPSLSAAIRPCTTSKKLSLLDAALPTGTERAISASARKTGAKNRRTARKAVKFVAVLAIGTERMRRVAVAG